MAPLVPFGILVDLVDPLGLPFIRYLQELTSRKVLTNQDLTQKKCTKNLLMKSPEGNELYLLTSLPAECLVLKQNGMQSALVAIFSLVECKCLVVKRKLALMMILFVGRLRLAPF